MRSRRHRAWWGLLGFVLALGVAGQVRVWASDRGFWNDELYIAINVRDKGFLELTGPLRYAQVAPPGWLATEKIMYRLLGGDEQVLRLPQLVAGAAVLVLTAVLANRIVGRWGALAATALVALAPMAYTYVGELKQYLVEAAAALGVLLMVEVLHGDAAQPAVRARSDVRELPAVRARPDVRGLPAVRGRLSVWAARPAVRAVAFAVVTMVAVFISYSALLVLAGAVAGLLVALASRRRWLAAAVALAAAAPAGLLGAFLVHRRMSFPFLSNQDDFFPSGLPPEGAGPVELLRWLPSMWRGFVESPVHWSYPWLVLGLAAGGVVALVVRDRVLWAAVLVGVFGAAVGAAALGGLPLQDRVALYLLAPLAITVVAGFDGAARALVRAARSHPAATVALGLALLLTVPAGVIAVGPAAAEAAQQVRNPRYRDVGRDVVRDVTRQLRPGDGILVYGFSQPLASWYGIRHRLPVTGLASAGPAGTCQPETVDAVLAGLSRVWYVRGAKWSRHPDNYHAYVLAQLARHGRIVGARVFGRGPVTGHTPGWVLVDLSRGPDPNPPAPPPAARYACLTVQPRWR